MIAQLNKNYIVTNPSKALTRLISYFFYEGRPATTRGRWFNPITFYSLRLAAKRLPVPSAESPIFITGTGRSGSTMLGMVLSMHPEVGFLNEPKALWYFANPLDDIIGSYTGKEASYIMKETVASETIGRKVKSVYSTFLNQTGSGRIVDKFPEMVFRIEFLNALFKDARFIFLFRNPWETISSTSAWSMQHSKGSKPENWWGVNNRKWKLLLKQVVPVDSYLSGFTDEISKFTADTDKAAVEWIVTMNFGLKMMEKFPGKILPVRYEALCHTPEKVLKEICEFTGLTGDISFRKFGKQIIQPARANQEPVVHPLLLGAISELSAKLGYQVQSPSMSVTE